MVFQPTRFTQPLRSLSKLVVSYTTFSPFSQPKPGCLNLCSTFCFSSLRLRRGSPKEPSFSEVRCPLLPGLSLFYPKVEHDRAVCHRANVAVCPHKNRKPFPHCAKRVFKLFMRGRNYYLFTQVAELESSKEGLRRFENKKFTVVNDCFQIELNAAIGLSIQSD